MTHHAHDHHHHHHGHEGHAADHRPAPWWARLHKDWRTYVVVGLMLLAMAVYVLTLDESRVPWGKPKPPVPAAP
jgi:hypothetical protein